MFNQTGEHKAVDHSSEGVSVCCSVALSRRWVSSIGDSAFQQQRATENINDGLLATDSGDIAVDTGMLNYNEAGLNLTALCEGFHHQVAATRIIISSKAAEPAARTRGK